MFQWNDDNCETKNNFICKYTKGSHIWQWPLFNMWNSETKPYAYKTIILAILITSLLSVITIKTCETGLCSEGQ